MNTTHPEPSLSERVRAVAEQIYQATKPDPNNWIEHTHGPNDTADSCAVCATLGLTQADWDNAYGVE